MFNKWFSYIIIFTILFIICFILKKQVENFTTIVVKGDIEKDPDVNEPLYRFSKLCIGDTCMNGNVLSSVIKLFNVGKHFRNESLCIDNVCIFPEHLDIFRNIGFRPPIYNTENGLELDKITAFKENYLSSDAKKDYLNKGFKLTLIDSTKDILKNNGLGSLLTDESSKSIWAKSSSNKYATKMMPGRVCYSPNDSYNVDKLFMCPIGLPVHTHKTTGKTLNDFTTCWKNNPNDNFNLFMFGQPYDSVSVGDVTPPTNTTDHSTSTETSVLQFQPSTGSSTVIGTGLE